MADTAVRAPIWSSPNPIHSCSCSAPIIRCMVSPRAPKPHLRRLAIWWGWFPGVDQSNFVRGDLQRCSKCKAGTLFLGNNQFKNVLYNPPGTFKRRAGTHNFN